MIHLIEQVRGVLESSGPPLDDAQEILKIDASETESPATLELTPGPTGLTYISHKAARRQPKVGTDQATNVQVLVSSVSMFILLMQ